MAKIPKKEDISVCDNSQRITLLSIPSKVFCRVILNRIRMVVNYRIREEQEGFRAGIRYPDQIFTLRNIVKQCIEQNAPFFVNLVDFWKASIVSIEILSQKMVSLIKLLYERLECGVVLKEGVLEFFEVQTGVRERCMLSHLLFINLIDNVIRIANEGSRGDIQ